MTSDRASEAINYREKRCVTMTLVKLRSSVRTSLIVALAAGLELVASPALAQSPGQDKASAEALFEEARALMKDGKYEAACPKLAESQRSDPGIGTLMYLASCYEKSGKLATAWATFREAAGAAHLAGQVDREKMATTRANALTAILPRLTIQPDLQDGEPEISRDGVIVAKPMWGTPAPVDPGTHVVEVRLAGHKPRTITIEIAKGETLNLPIAALERDEAPAVSAPAPVAPPTTPAAPAAEPAKTTPTRRALPYAAAGVGLVGVVVGTVFGARALSLASDVDQACPSGPCSPAVRDMADDSKSAGNVSTIAFAVGAVGIAAAAVLWLTAPHPARTATRKALLPDARGLMFAF